MHTCIWKNTTKYFKLIYNYNKEIINIPDLFGIRPINYAAFMGKKDLVILMLDSGALINNPYKKDPKILDYLKKYHQNIIKMSELLVTHIRLTLGDTIRRYFNFRLSLFFNSFRF